MKPIDAFFQEYGESHQNKTNKLIHWLCVPLIFWSIMGFLSLIPSGLICIQNYFCFDYALGIAFILVSLFYLRLSIKIGIIMMGIMLVSMAINYYLNLTLGSKSWMLYLGIFIITWIFQFIGHKIEGKKPSFLKDIQFLLIGPIWLIHFILKKLNISY